MSELQPICLALQGGGSHGAYGAGVVEALLESGRFQVAGVSGTSAGALNAAALVQGLSEPDRPGDGVAAALRCLERLWAEVGRRSPLSAADALPRPAQPLVAPFVQAWLKSAGLLGRFVSPYQPGLPSTNALRPILHEVIDIGVLHRAAVPLFVSATAVRTGDRRVFANQEITYEALLASACLPDLFQAVAVDGEAYWDGGFTGNPCIEPLIEAVDGCQDIVVVQVTPFVRDGLPEDAGAIMNRVSEITFNVALLGELKVISKLQQVLEGATSLSPLARRLAGLRLHLVQVPHALARMGSASKLDTRPSHLAKLRDMGRGAGRAWLASEASALVGRTGGLDLDRLLQATR